MLQLLSEDPRVTVRTRGVPDPDGRCVVYWMQRAQRAVDNPALDLAIRLGNELHVPVVTFFGLNPFIERANGRHYRFLVEGLADIATGLRERQVGFILRRYPDHRLLPFADEVRPAIVVGDENPLRQTEGWRQTIADELRVPLWTVDADVVVPVTLQHKEQYAARTIRPRLLNHLNEFLVASTDPVAAIRWRAPRGVTSLRLSARLLDGLPIDNRIGAVADICGGTTEARRRLRTFVRTRLTAYDQERNHPERPGTSQLSPYLHFGHIGPREVGLAVRDSGGPAHAVEAFLEQLIVRRELAVNFVSFNDKYDRLAGCERWARQTLTAHRRDRRSYLYDEARLESGDTHDPLWNAAQLQMVTSGWMHGYVRMYWAKKILEWTPSPEHAFDLAVRLNDRYLLDGRDPNGYANIAWAIGGKHDRPWPPRPIYGTVRSMSHASTVRKFDAQRYIEQNMLIVSRL
jgi:deoxyribodipyrimidine photo-lyase